MPDVSQQVAAAIITYKTSDPRLYEAIMKLNEQLHNVTNQLEPLVKQSETGIDIPPDLSGLFPPSPAVIFTGETVRFKWAAMDEAVSYECRVGNDWDTASFQFRTINLQADIDPITVGDHSYLFKSMDIGGNYSPEYTQVLVTIPPLPILPISGLLIDNNILLSWTTPATTFNIKHYEVYKDGVILGTQFGTFFTRFEAAGGTFVYSIIAVDIAGNRGPESKISLIVKSPVDFVLRAHIDSDLSGTKNNILLETNPSRLLGPIDTSQTWDSHFTSHGWTTIQNQLDAGYPLYIQPTVTSGSPNGYYEEIVDYGLIFTTGIITVVYNYTFPNPSHTVSVAIKMAVSTDGVTYSAFTVGAAQYLQNFRWVKFRIELTASDALSLIEMFQLSYNVSVKAEVDSGLVQCHAADVSGTVVLFNKVFKDIDSIVTTPKNNISLKALYSFNDIPNPTSFNVYVFNDAGVRQDCPVTWVARGIV